MKCDRPAILVQAVASGDVVASAARRIGPALAFERLWEETGCRAVVENLAGARNHYFPLERAIFQGNRVKELCGNEIGESIVVPRGGFEG